MQRELNVTFNPLFEGASEATLEAVSADLGTYVYVFKLTALPPVPEGPIYFTAALGEIISQKLLLKNDRADKTEFLIKVQILSLLVFGLRKVFSSLTITLFTRLEG